MGRNRLLTIPPEIKYYFCIPFIAYVFVKFKRFVLYLSILGYAFCVANEQLQILPFSEGYPTKTGGLLVAYFTHFFAGSLTAYAYYFIYEPQRLREAAKW